MNYCEQCALRLFNKKCHNLQGIGNPFNGKLIILPNVDYDAYKAKDMNFSKQVEVILSDISFTGVLTEVYILPLIRCNESIGCDITEDILIRCQQYLKEDFKTYNFKHIMLCGSAVDRFLHSSISKLKDKIVISANNRFYYSNYSPLIKFIDKERYKEFILNVDKFINSAMYEDYSNYEIIK